MVATLFLLSPCATGAQAGAELHALIADLFTPDPNAGSTSFRSLLIPMGGLAEGMGLAYTAVSKDSSYLESNPAASSSLALTELAVFHNNWIADTRIEGLVYTVRFDRLGLGIGGKWLYLPIPGYDDFGGRTGSGYYSEASLAFNASWRFLPGYDFDGIALGATARMAMRSVPELFAATGTIGDSALATMIDIGALMRFNVLKFYSSRAKNAAVGLALMNFGPPPLGEKDPDGLPTVARLGLAWSPLRPLLLSFDIAQPIDLVDISRSEQASLAAGFEMGVTSSFSFQGGLLLKGGNPRLSIGSTFEVDKLLKLVINYTLDLTTQMSPLNRVSLQASFIFGDGGRGKLAKEVDRLYLVGIDAYARGNTEVAAAAFRSCIALDKAFEPAREGLEAALSLQNTGELILEMTTAGGAPAIP